MLFCNLMLATTALCAETWIATETWIANAIHASIWMPKVGKVKTTPDPCSICSARQGGWYQSVNPIERTRRSSCLRRLGMGWVDGLHSTNMFDSWLRRTIYGEWARVLSLLVGVILCGMGVLLLHLGSGSLDRDDVCGSKKRPN